MRIKTVRLHEVQELEPRVISQISEIEDGLQVLQNQFTIELNFRQDLDAVGVHLLIAGGGIRRLCGGGASCPPSGHS